MNDELYITGYDEIPAPPSGASRWAEAEANAPVMKESDPWMLPVGFNNAAAELGRRAASMASYGKDNAKQAVNYGIDALAAKLGGVGGYSGYEGTEGINERVPANNQSWWKYDTKLQDYDTEKDFPYSSYAYGEAIDPSNEYANFTDTDVYNSLEPDSYAGAVATGTLGYLGDSLPEQIEALLGELGVRGTMSFLGPFGAKMLGNMKDSEKGREFVKGRPEAEAIFERGRKADLQDFVDQARAARSNGIDILHNETKDIPREVFDSYYKSLSNKAAGDSFWGPINIPEEEAFIKRYLDADYDKRDVSALRRILERISGGSENVIGRRGEGHAAFKNFERGLKK